jgi:hypothetical protein
VGRRRGRAGAYALEDNDDVDAVHANLDIEADVLERAAGV